VQRILRQERACCFHTEGMGRRQRQRQEVIVESRQELLIKDLLDAWIYFMSQEETVEEF